MIPLFFGLVGLIVGSFLNVVIFRYGEKSLRGRSACMHCKKQLQWLDMAPVFSWLLLRGRCRFCKARISIQYPLVEGSTGVLFAGIGAAPLPLVLAPLPLAIVALLVCISAYDLQHTIIPDLWVYPFIALSFLFSALLILPSAWEGNDFLLLILAGPASASILFALWAASRGRWMGFGDVKLALGIGWLLGFPLGIVAVFFAFLLGAAVTVPLLLWGKLLSGGNFGLTMKSEVPFGPFLITSCLLVWFALLYNIPLPLSI